MLGPEIAKDKGLNVKFIISKKPIEAKVAARAIPTIIFGPGVEESEKKRLIRRWTGDNSLDDFDLRTLLDWDYYKERLGSTIQKIITIPAAL
jgi:DNA polymerase epsilon subunit 1